MKTKLTPIAAAAAVALAGAIAPAFAQTAAPAPAAAASAPKADEDVQRIEVTGIRGSLQSSLNQKRNAASHVEVITAEDIGKLPDKNVADSLAHVPGVTISSAGANEGGFDESDRVSMRGTSPSLTQTLINGHNVATGDWFVLDQAGTVGRSVSYTLLPSEIVGSVVVHKTSQASLVEGGVAGSIDIITRKPLDFKQPVTVNVGVGAVYSDLPKKGDAQLNGLLNWKNDAGTFGVLLQAFSEQRHLRRDGVEVLGYDTISATSAAATAHPDLAGVLYPHLIGAAEFEQYRKRTGGVIDIEVKPNSSTTLDLNAFSSKMTATNINRNLLLWTNHFVSGQVPTSYTVQNGVMTAATYPAGVTTNADSSTTAIAHGIYDQISRPGEASESHFVDLDGKFQLTDRLVVKTQLGSTSGYGQTPTQDVAEFDIGGVGNAGSYQLNGKNSTANFGLTGVDYTKLQPVGTNDNAASSSDWIFGEQNVKVDDREKWGQVDAEYDIGMGPLVALKFGVRGAEHNRALWGAIGQGPITDPALPAPPNPDAFNHVNNIPGQSGNYPSNFGTGLGGGFPTNVWTFSPAEIAAYNAKSTRRDLASRHDFGSDYGLRERTYAGYLQGDLEGEKWSGDVGLRLVNTKEHIQNYQTASAATPGNVSSDFGRFVLTTTDHSYTDALPSANLKLDVAKDMIVRFGASRTMTRADYSQLAGAVSLGTTNQVNNTGGGSGGNPDLKPITSNNLDASWEYYFAPRALLSASVFYMNLTSYVGYGSVHKTFTTYDGQHPNGQAIDYTLTVPVNAKGDVKGLELAWEQPLYGNFGATVNYTYTDASAAGGLPLVGASKNTYNVGGYFENDMFHARVTYNYRSSFYSGLDRSTAYYQGNTGELTASVGMDISKNFDISLDGRNLNDPKLRYYSADNQPRASYNNGRQFYLQAHFKY